MNNGKEGEKLFAQIMEQRGYTVQDVSANESYFDKDIDFIVTSATTGATKSFEVKWCSRINRTGNLFLEIANPRSKQWNGEGWWKHCEADYLVYGDAARRAFYVFSMKDLRERVGNLRLYTKSTSDNSVGIILPLELVRDLYTEL